jgi:hypothetical protein
LTTTSATAIAQRLSSAQQLAISIEIAPISANIDAVTTLLETTLSNPIGTQLLAKEVGSSVLQEHRQILTIGGSGCHIASSIFPLQ